MKETIKYYYNIDVQNLEEKSKRYHFQYEGNDFFFVYFSRSKEELNDLLTCVKELKNKNIDCHDIIVNINHEVLTKVGTQDYILLRVNNMLEKYDILDIDSFNKKLVLNNYKSSLYRNNWAKLWSDKNDYFEYQIRELGLDKKLITSSFSYYLGLAENAIAVVNVINKKYYSVNPKIVLAHRRIFYPNWKLNFLNPLAFIFDLQVRDVAEYLKAMFFNDDFQDCFIELETYLKISSLSFYEYNMLWARLLYPTYYFDIYDEIMNNNKDENLLMKIINKQKSFEAFLKKAYLELSKYATIEHIAWLID